MTFLIILFVSLLKRNLTDPVLHLNDFKKQFLDNYKNPESKMAFYADDINLNLLNAACECQNLVLEEELYGYQSSFQMMQFNFLSLMIDETMRLISPFGILQHSADYYKWMLLDRWQKDIDSGPKVLTLNSLSFGFVFWLFACAISCMGFFMELMHIKLRRHFRTLIGLVLFLMLLYCRLNTCAYL